MGIKHRARKPQTIEKHGVTFLLEAYKPKGSSGPVEHLVFSNRQDYESYFMGEMGIIPKVAENWRTATVGEWVEADDGGVLQIIAAAPLSHPQDRNAKPWSPNGYKRTIVGTFVAVKNVEMDSDFYQHPSRYTFSKDPRAGNSASQIRNRTYNTKKERQFAMLFLAYVKEGNQVIPSMMLAYKDAFSYSGSAEKTKNKAMLLLQQKRIMRLLKDQMDSAASEIGITIKAVLQHTWEMATDKTEDGHYKTEDKTRLAALNKSGEYIGMTEQDAPNQIGAGANPGGGWIPPGETVEQALPEGVDVTAGDMDAMDAEFKEVDAKQELTPETIVAGPEPKVDIGEGIL